MNNIKLSYYLTFFFHLTFWSGIWLLYYQRYTDYAGIGIIESAAILTGFLIEIPSGALADIIGRKKTIVLAFLSRAIGETIMGLATVFFHLPLAVIIISSGYSFLSGSQEAIIYDTLKEHHQEHTYSKVIANLKTVELIAKALASIIGGSLLYNISPGLPFIACSLAAVIGFAMSWKLQEPAIDSQKFNLKKYFNQSKQGFKELFAKNLKPISLSLIFISALYYIMYEIGGDALIVELGFSPKELGFYYAILFLTSAGATQFISRLQQVFSPKNLLIVSTLIFASILIISTLINPYLAAFLLLFSAWIHYIFDNSVSTILNHRISSKDRATSISTFKMLQAAPYALTAFTIGKVMDTLTAKGFSAMIGALLAVTLIPVYFTLTKHQKNLKL